MTGQYRPIDILNLGRVIFINFKCSLASVNPLATSAVVLAIFSAQLYSLLL